MLNKTIKRFYKQANVEAAEGGFAVQLDKRGVKTPAGKKLVVPALALADSIAAEWDAQGEEVHPGAMPMTQMASTALDRVGPERPAIVEQMLAFAGTDLLCYRAEHPMDLVERQARQWQPLLDWARQDLGADLVATDGLIAISQPQAAVDALAARLESYDVWRLTAAQAACAAAGSLVLALAMVEGRLTGAETFALSQLEEAYQVEKWGSDAEAEDRREILRRDILAAERLLRLL